MKKSSKQYVVSSMGLLFTLTSYFLLPASLVASTISFSPTSASVRPGQVVSVQIYIDPQGSAYTAKVALSFTPGILSFSSFSQASGWLPLTQPGYDLVDNSSGKVVKTAGYAGGISGPQLFGTAVFVANTNGVANISIGSGTEILNDSNQNTFTSGGQVSVNISSPTPTPTSQSSSNPSRPLAQTSKKSPAVSEVATTTATSTATIAEIISTTTSSNELVAQAASTANIPYNIIIPIVTFLLGFALGRMKA